MRDDNCAVFDLPGHSSRVFVLALENFVRDYQDRLLFEKINKASDDAPPDKAERKRLQQIVHHHRRMVEGDM